MMQMKLIDDVNFFFQRKKWVQYIKLTIEQNIKYQKNKIVWNGLETKSYLRPRILKMVSEEMKSLSNLLVPR